MGSADGDADVAVVVDRDRAAVEDQVAGADAVGAPVHGDAVLGLCGALVREVDADLLVCAHGEAGAVEGFGSGASPQVWLAELRLRIRDHGRDVGRHHSADADAAAISGEVAAVDWERASGELPVRFEPGGLVLAHGEGVAVLGVRDSVHPLGRRQREREVPGQWDTRQAPSGEDRFDEDCGLAGLEQSAERAMHSGSRRSCPTSRR